MSLSNLTTLDLNVLTQKIKTSATCFVSPYLSFEESYAYLKDLNTDLKSYLILLEDYYIFCHQDTHVIPKLDLPESFPLLLFLACRKNQSLALDIYHLLDEHHIHNHINTIKSIFLTQEFPDNNNPYYAIFNRILKGSEELIEGHISHTQFMGLIEQKKDILFLEPVNIPEFNPIVDNIEEEINEEDNAQFLLINDKSIIYLKEKIYLNMLSHFIDKPDCYKQSPYLFIDFLRTFSFNTNDTYSFIHLKPIFWRFNDTHWNVLKSLKNHPLYHIVLDTLFIDNTLYFPGPDEHIDQYICYFDFQSFHLMINKNLILDDLFLCQATNNQNMKDFLYSIVAKNNYEPDNQRLLHLMILYEKNKMEKKFKVKNITSNLHKI